MRITTAIQSFLQHCRYEKNLSAKTLRAYETDLRQFRDALGEATEDVRLIEKEHLRTYVRALFATYAEASIIRKVATLKAWYSFLEREDVLQANPMRKMGIQVRAIRRVPQVLTLATVQILFEHLYGEVAKTRGAGGAAHATAVRDLALLELLFATGARVSEVCNLRESDVDLSSAHLLVVAKGRKERVIHLPQGESLAAVRDYDRLRAGLFPPGGYFFRSRSGGRLSEQSARALLRKQASRAGIEQPVRPHLIRHTVATLLLEEGVDVRNIQHLLGHSSIATTQIYTHISDVHHRTVIMQNHPRRRVHVGPG